MNLTKLSYKAYFSFIASILGPLGLIFLYAQALLQPEKHGEFIYKAGMALFMVEFITIHSTGTLLIDHGKQGIQKKSTKFFILGFYCLCILGFSFGLKTYFIGIYFIVSLCSKVFMGKIAKGEQAKQVKKLLGITAINFLLATALTIPMASFLEKTFPIANSIRALKSDNSSGLFVDTPQTLMAWGIFYFSFTVILNLIVFYKERKKSQVITIENKEQN